MDRAFPSGGKGRRFDSYREYAFCVITYGLSVFSSKRHKVVYHQKVKVLNLFRNFSLINMQLITTIFGILFLIFVVSGYWLSDDKYFSDLIKTNQIETIEDSFRFVSNSIEFPGSEEMVGIPMTPKYMLQQKYVWCDQGAIILATMVNKLGHKTRLLDMKEEDGIFGHTVLQIYENNQWINYDTVLKKKNLTPEEIRKHFKHDENSKIFHYYTRPYPNTYNFFIQNNFYLKELALFMRGGVG